MKHLSNYQPGTTVYVLSNLRPLNTKQFRLGTVNRGHVTFRHETKYVDVDIHVNASFECDILAFGNHLI